MKNKVKFNLQYPSKARSPIMAICRCGGRTVKRSLNITIPTNVWDKQSQRCIISPTATVRENRSYKKTNKRLAEIEQSWNDFTSRNNVELYEIASVASIFDNHLKGATQKAEEEDHKANRTPLEFFQEYIEKIPTMICGATKRNVSVKTQGHHRVILKRLMAYMEATHTPNSFDMFDAQFEARFTNWAYHVARPGRGYSRNSVGATFSILKLWLEAARKEGLLHTEFYKKLKTKEFTEDKISLTEEDITALYNLDIPKLMADGLIDSKSTMEVTRDLFVVGCWTGLRRSDLCRLNEGIFDFESNVLTIQTQKTKAMVQIPLHPYVQALYAKYDGNFPKLVDKSKSNSHLKELGRLAGLNKEVQQSETLCGEPVSKKYLKYQCISFHTARRSFATNLYRRNMPTLAIMSMTGHTSEANFLKYIKITKEEYAKRCQGFFTVNNIEF